MRERYIQTRKSLVDKMLTRCGNRVDNNELSRGACFLAESHECTEQVARKSHGKVEKREHLVGRFEPFSGTLLSLDREDNAGEY